jgi:hypothetical protein
MAFNNSGPTSTARGEARKSDQLDGSIASENTKSATATQPFNWRAHLPVHPAADAFPLLSEKGLKELAGDIKRNGVQSELVFWHPPANDEEDVVAKPQLVDGRNRLDALTMLGLLKVKSGTLPSCLASRAAEYGGSS